MQFADAALARRLEMREAIGCAEYACVMARLRPDSGATSLPVAGAYAVFTGVDSPISRAIGLGMEGPVTAADLDLVEEFYHSHGAAVQVDLCPLADGSLPELLSRRGYRIKEFNNVHVRRLCPGEAFRPSAPGVSVAIAGPAEGDLWAATVARGFAGRDEVTPADLEIATPMFHRPGVTCFLARVDGEPAGGAAMEVSAGLAAFFSTSTRSPFRNRGVQTALLHARLADAAAAGCELATVETVPGSDSQRNVERAEFMIVYTKLTVVREFV